MPHGLPEGAQAGVSAGLRRRARAGLAAIAGLAFIAAASSPALADQARQNEWWLRTLHVTNAWHTTRGAGVSIAVLDTGVDRAQADLTGSVTTGPDYTHSGRTPGGQFWGINGTEVASLIAGHGHGAGRANGMIGIAPAARILSVRVTLESNDPQLANQTIAAGLPGAIARGIRWAVRHDASVIDLPLDPVPTPGAPGSGGSPAERAAVAYALAKHVVLVAPAGDGGAGTDPVNYPADYHGVIAVGAFDRHFVKAPFTSHQPYVTVTAAGTGVTAAGPSGTYPQLNSTSMASAVVAGIAALIRAQFPTLTPAQVTKALTTSTVYRPAGGRADGSGFGTVDAARALTAAAGIAETVSKSAASGSTSGQGPPSPPAAHRGPIHRNIRGTLIKDAVIAGVVFLLLLGLIFGIAAWRRRRARSARLAEVRAAARVPARKPGPAAAKTAAAKTAAAKKSAAKKPAAKTAAAKKPASGKAAAKKGAGGGDRVPAAADSPAGTSSPAGAGSPAAEPQLEPAGFIAAPLGSAIPAPGPSGFTGSASPGFTGSGFTGSAATFTGSGFTGSGSSGFTGSASSGFTGSGSSGIAAASTPPSVPAALPGLAAAAGLGAAAAPGAARPDPAPGTAAHGASAAGAVPPGDQAAAAATGTGTPPWARMQSDPHGAAIPDSAFPGSAFPGSALPGSAFPSSALPGSALPGIPAAPPAGEVASGTGTAFSAAGEGAGLDRPGSRLAQGPRQARAQQVSGRPPWEPAPEPHSELPWAQPLAPSPAGPASLPKREEVRPDLPWWDELAQEAWPGGPKAAGPHPPVPPVAGTGDRPGQQAGPAISRAARGVPAARLAPPQPDSPGQAGPAERQPGYRWDPGAGVRPFRAAQAEPTGAAGGTGQASATAAAATGPAAASQPGVSPGRRPSLALPRRIGSAMPDQAGGASVPGLDASLAGGASGAGLTGGASGAGLSGAGPAGAFSGAGGTGAGASSASWPGTGAGQPPFPPAPRPATDPASPGTGQPEKGPFPRAIRPPMDPAAASSAAGSAGATGGWAPGAGTTGAGPTGGAGTGAGTPGAGAGSSPGPAFPAAKPEGEGAKPKTGVPPWEITDSFLAVPPAGGPSWPGAVPRPPTPPAVPAQGTGPVSADSTDSFPDVDSGPAGRSFPRADPGDSTEIFPAIRPRADLEDAFRLFPPVRGTGNSGIENKPPEADTD